MKKMFSFSWKVFFVLFVSFVAVACSNGGGYGLLEDYQVSRLINGDDDKSLNEEDYPVTLHVRHLDKSTKTYKENEKTYRLLVKLEKELNEVSSCDDLKKVAKKINDSGLFSDIRNINSVNEVLEVNDNLVSSQGSKNLSSEPWLTIVGAKSHFHRKFSLLRLGIGCDAESLEF